MILATSLRVVIFKDGDLWIAQALEHDICARATDLKKLKARFGTVVHLEREHSKRNNKDPFAGIDPAPKHFFDLWEERSGFVQKQDDMQLALCA